MKQTYFLRMILPVILFLCLKISAFAQPAGANMANAINAGSLSPGVTFTDTKNNSPANGYGNDMGQSSDDIYYKFTLSSNTDVNISHCSSAFDTYMHLLDVNGNIIASNDDLGPLCSTLQASVRMQLAAGTYYVVSEGFSTNSGDITTSITTLLTYDYDYTAYVDSLMQHLDKSGVTTGILYDRVTPLASLQDFNKPAADTSSYWHFIQAYSEIYRSAYSGSTWSTVKDIQGQVLADKIQGIVPGRPG